VFFGARIRGRQRGHTTISRWEDWDPALYSARSGESGMTVLLRMLYVSESRRDLSSGDLHRIRAVAERNNWRAGLTGCLLYSGRNFAQILEGSPDRVRAAYSRITEDERHSNVKLLREERCSSRRFASWSMAFVYRVDAADLVDALLGLQTQESAMVEELVGQFDPSGEA
jgi:Sensors of blue-light using FAD